MGRFPVNKGGRERAEKHVGCVYVEAYCSQCHRDHLCGRFSHQQWLTGHESMHVWTESVQHSNTDVLFVRAAFFLDLQLSEITTGSRSAATDLCCSLCHAWCKPHLILK